MAKADLENFVNRLKILIVARRVAWLIIFLTLEAKKSFLWITKLCRIASPFLFYLIFVNYIAILKNAFVYNPFQFRRIFVLSFFHFQFKDQLIRRLTPSIDFLADKSTILNLNHCKISLYIHLCRPPSLLIHNIIWQKNTTSLTIYSVAYRSDAGQNTYCLASPYLKNGYLLAI